MASRNPALPLDSHVQSHAEVFKNELREFLHSPHSESDRRWLDSDPLLTLTSVGYREAETVLPQQSIVMGSSVNRVVR